MLLGAVVAVVTLMAVGGRERRPRALSPAGGRARRMAPVAMPFSRGAGGVVGARRVVEPGARQRSLHPHGARQGDEAESGGAAAHGSGAMGGG